MKTALVLGGTRFFGKRLVEEVIAAGVQVTVATRGMTQDSLGDAVERVVIDRFDKASMERAFAGKTYDVVYDQQCYVPSDAMDAVEVFAGKAGKYVFTSSMAVYKQSQDVRSEQDFDPYHYPIRLGERDDFDYGEGKRLCEAVFFQKADFPVAALRIPVVVGEDDYTRRLHFHVESVREGKPIGVPNPDTKQCYITSQEAGRFLHFLGTSDVTGPINACADGITTLGGLIGLIEEIVGKKAMIVPPSEGVNRSPYGFMESWYLDNTKAKEAGFEFTKLEDWMPGLIKNLAEEK